jgi:hypothetical protein
MMRAELLRQRRLFRVTDYSNHAKVHSRPRIERPNDPSRRPGSLRSWIGKVGQRVDEGFLANLTRGVIRVTAATVRKLTVAYCMQYFQVGCDSFPALGPPVVGPKQQTPFRQLYRA